MRLSASEKHEIIQIVTRSEIGVKRTLEEFGIARSTFYKWYSNYLENGFEGLESKIIQPIENGIVYLILRRI